MKDCAQCGKQHNRKRFCSNACKDRYHNIHNPRGLFAETAAQRHNREEDEDYHAAMSAAEAGWDGHKEAW